MITGVLKAVRALLAITRNLSAALLACSVLVNFANIVGRYFFSVSITWAEEIMLFLMVGCVFTGCCAVAWEGRHIRMDVLVSLMPKPAREALELAFELLLIATSALVAIFSWPVVSQLAAFDERSAAANFPMVIPQAMIPIGYTLMALMVIVRLLTRRRE
jgi:TRAP-type C4-dicarboxylate transport system permease small subunit